jgi:hypothetical protein
MGLGDAFRRGRDQLAQAAIRAYAEQKFEALGKVNSLELDSGNRTIRCELALKGEPGPIEIVVDRYELETEGEKAYLKILSCRISREWMQRLAEQFLVGRRFEVPPAVRAVL